MTKKQVAKDVWPVPAYIKELFEAGNVADHMTQKYARVAVETQAVEQANPRKPGYVYTYNPASGTVTQTPEKKPPQGSEP